MLMVISPAKTLDFESPLATEEFSQPDFLKQSRILIKALRELSPEQVSSLMHISPKLGELNHERFMNWKTPFSPKNARPAVLAFQGDVYQGLNAASFKKADFNFAQKHLRILSGLYGVLRPLDLIQAYRLEMGTKFENPKGKNLYEFWGDELTQALNAALEESRSHTLLNLASTEYFKAVNKKALAADLVSPEFKDLKNGEYKIISFYAKRARGLMAAYVIKHRVKDIEGLKQFDLEGYRYNPELSLKGDPVFTRDEPV